MILKPQHLLPLFEQVNKVRETLATYCLAPDEIPISKQNLRTAFEEEFQIKVVVRTVPLESSLIRGLIEIYDDRSIIYIDGSLNSAWTRYVHANELSQHLFNNDEYHTDDLAGLIEEKLHDERLVLEDGHGQQCSKAACAEEMTKFAAIEFLMPFKTRSESKRQLSSGEKTVYDLAQEYDVPEHLLEYALSEQYNIVATHLWGIINP